MKSKKGFTLIELLVTITIIAMLATVGFVSYRAANSKSRNSKRQGDLEQVRAAMEMYRTDIGCYPPYTIDTDGDCITIVADVDYSDAMDALVSDYMGAVLQDPQESNASVDGYEYETDGYVYELCSHWEGTSPSDCGFGTHATVGGDAGYGVNNP